MKYSNLALACAASVVAACRGEPVVTDPYADLGADSLMVRFEANPDIEDGQCNPNVHYALRTEEDYVRLNANYEVVDHNLTGAGGSLFNENASGIARTTIELNVFDPYPVPCSELHVRVQQLSCATDREPDSVPCPTPKFEGTDMFASFRGLPAY